MHNPSYGANAPVQSGNACLQFKAPEWMWLTSFLCSSGGFYQSALVTCLIIVWALWLCSTEHSSGQRTEKQWATDCDMLLSNVCFVFFNWTRYSRRTWEITAPTCILTAIDREFSSLSSSLRTTSFFNVRLQSLWGRKRTREGERKRNTLVTWLTQCEHTFTTSCSIWGWKVRRKKSTSHVISACVLHLTYYFFAVC